MYNLTVTTFLNFCSSFFFFHFREIVKLYFSVYVCVVMNFIMS